MNLYRNCLLILAIIVSTGISQASAAENTTNKQAVKLKQFSPGRWVASYKFIRKNTVCYREYICQPNGGDRFGRNLRNKGTKLQRGKNICSGSANTCQCKTTPPTLRCDVKYLKRR